MQSMNPVASDLNDSFTMPNIVSGLILLSDTPSLHISEQECADWELSQCAKLSGLEGALVEIPFTSGQQEQAS